MRDGHECYMAVNSQTLQILRIDRDGMIDDVIITLVMSLPMTSYHVFNAKESTLSRYLGKTKKK